MSRPLVSIIIPTYNRAHLLPTALSSLVAQTYQNWEALIIDDGSVDNTENVINTYCKTDNRFKFLKRDRQPKGAPTCRNIGLHKSLGDYVIFLDSDDYLLPFCIESRINKILIFPENGFLVFPSGMKKDNIISKKNIPKSDSYLDEFLSSNIAWQVQCPIWKKELLIELNGFTEGYPRFNDPELMIRALIRDDVKYHVFLEPEYDSVFTIGDKNESVFIDIVYKSLRLFITDISEMLLSVGKAEKRKYLAMYLHLWFKYFFVKSKNSKVSQSLCLIILFSKAKVISREKSFELILKLLLFSFSRFLLSKPIDKISNRALYK